MAQLVDAYSSHSRYGARFLPAVDSAFEGAVDPRNLTNPPERDADAEQRREVVDRLISAADRCLAALDDGGDIGGAEFEAREQLSRARNEIQGLRESELSEIGDRLANAAQQRDRKTLRAVIRELNELLESAATVVQQPQNRVSRYLSAPFRYVGSDQNRIGDRILVGVAVTVVGGVILAAIVFIVGLVPGGDSTSTHTTSQAAHSTAAPKAVSAPRPGDGRDPKESGCSPPAEDVPGTTVKLAGHGLSFGTFVLRHSPRCNAAWGEVRGLGPEEKLRLVLLTNRPSNHATTSYAQFGHFNVEGVYGNELLQTHGCVLAIAVIEHNGKKLARAQTPCR